MCFHSSQGFDFICLNVTHRSKTPYLSLKAIPKVMMSHGKLLGNTKLPELPNMIFFALYAMILIFAYFLFSDYHLYKWDELHSKYGIVNVFASFPFRIDSYGGLGPSLL